jgi:hypothetical protein
MSNLKEWLNKRRSKFYEGETLRQHCDAFLEMVEGAAVYEFEDAIIVLEKHGLPGNVRGWLLFDKFTRNTARAIQKVSNESQDTIFASTHDKRIKDLLLKFGYVQYHADEHDFYLVRRR